MALCEDVPLHGLAAVINQMQFENEQLMGILERENDRVDMLQSEKDEVKEATSKEEVLHEELQLAVKDLHKQAEYNQFCVETSRESFQAMKSRESILQADLDAKIESQRRNEEQARGYIQKYYEKATRYREMYESFPLYGEVVQKRKEKEGLESQIENVDKLTEIINTAKRSGILKKLSALGSETERVLFLVKEMKQMTDLESKIADKKREQKKINNPVDQNKQNMKLYNDKSQETKVLPEKIIVATSNMSITHKEGPQKSAASQQPTSMEIDSAQQHENTERVHPVKPNTGDLKKIPMLKMPVRKYGTKKDVQKSAEPTAANPSPQLVQAKNQHQDMHGAVVSKALNTNDRKESTISDRENMTLTLPNKLQHIIEKSTESNVNCMPPHRISEKENKIDMVAHHAISCPVGNEKSACVVGQNSGGQCDNSEQNVHNERMEDGATSIMNNSAIQRENGVNSSSEDDHGQTTVQQMLWLKQGDDANGKEMQELSTECNQKEVCAPKGDPMDSQPIAEETNFQMSNFDFSVQSTMDFQVSDNEKPSENNMNFNFDSASFSTMDFSFSPNEPSFMNSSTSALNLFSNTDDDAPVSPGAGQGFKFPFAGGNDDDENNSEGFKFSFGNDDENDSQGEDQGFKFSFAGGNDDENDSQGDDQGFKFSFAGGNDDENDSEGFKFPF